VTAKFEVQANLDALATQVRESVAKAKPDDWMAYMNAAQFLFDNKIDVKEASAMIDKSIQVKETWRNLMVKGDMLAAEKKPADAIAAYTKAIERAKEDDGTKTFREMLTDEFNKKIRALK
jgi:predicted negative regulator of RcsB-dependent stress response